MLNIRNVQFSISQSSILNGVNLEVSAGETLGIIGPNGSGKTTLFNTISGFHRPQTGQIIFKEKDVTSLRPFQRAQLGLGRVFQNFGIFREMTVLENVITAMEGKQSLLQSLNPWNSDSKKMRERAMAYLEEVKLNGKASAKAGSLSGGQMRLLEIIRTLAFGAELFLLDEPTAGVSPKMKDEVAELIQALQAQKKTVLIIEHDINFIRKFCDRIAVLDMGKVILNDRPEIVSQSETLQEIYFGTGDAEA